MRTLFAVLMSLAAGGAHAVDLVGAYERALRHDPAMRAADEALLAGREKAVQGDALLKPRVQLSAGYARIEDRSSASGLPPSLAAPESSGAAYQATVQLKHPLYDAKAAAEKEQLHRRTELAELSHRDARQDLAQRVSEAYFHVLLAEEHLRVVLAEMAAVGLQLERAQARFELGRSRVTEVQETQARYDGVLAKEISARSMLELRRAQFRELTGLAAEGLAVLRSGFAPEPVHGLEAWQRRGLEHNARVQAKRSALAIARAETGKHGLAARPSLELVASYGHKDQDGGLSPFTAPEGYRSAQIGVQLTIPLYAGGALDSRERESAARLREAEQDLAAAERDARLQVQDAFLAVGTGAARVAALGQSVRSAQTALEATTLGRDVGTRTDLDVLDAQQRLFGAQLDLAQARFDYLLGRVRLAHAAGELSVQDLHSLNGYLAN